MKIYNLDNRMKKFKSSEKFKLQIETCLRRSKFRMQGSVIFKNLYNLRINLTFMKLF